MRLGVIRLVLSLLGALLWCWGTYSRKHDAWCFVVGTVLLAICLAMRWFSLIGSGYPMWLATAETAIPCVLLFFGCLIVVF